MLDQHPFDCPFVRRFGQYIQYALCYQRYAAWLASVASRFAVPKSA